MIIKDKVYIINVNNLRQVWTIPISDRTPVQVADKMLGRKVGLYLISRPGFRSMFLTSDVYAVMIAEVARWMKETPTCNDTSHLDDKRGKR